MITQAYEMKLLRGSVVITNLGILVKHIICVIVYWREKFQLDAEKICAC